MSLFLYIYGQESEKLQPAVRKSIKEQLLHFSYTQINEYSDNHLQLICSSPYRENIRIFNDQDNNFTFFIQGNIFESVNGLSSPRPDFAENSLENQIIRRYTAKGIASCIGLNGIYNLIIWDRKNRSLEIAGDRLGILQLFFTPVGDGAFVLTTDILILKHLPNYRAKISRRGIFDMLYMGVAFETRSILENVERLLPNTGYRIFGNKLTVVDKHRLFFSDLRWKDNADNILNEFEHYYLQAVKRHFRSQEKVVFLQSGGKDSRVFSYFLKQAGVIPQCFSAGLNHHADVYLAKIVSKTLGFPWQRISAGLDFYPELAEKILAIDSFSCRIFETWVAEIIHKLSPDFDCITSTLSGDPVFGYFIQFGRLEEKNDCLSAFKNFFNFSRSGFFSNEQLKKLFPQEAEDWIADYQQEAFEIFKDSGNSPFQMLIGYELRTNNRSKIGCILRNINSAFPLRAPVLDVDLMDFIFSLPQHFLNQRYLLDIFLQQRAKKLGAIHLSQNSRKCKALLFSLKQEARFRAWHYYVCALKLPLLKISNPLSATTQFYLQVFSLKNQGFQKIKEAAFSRLDCLEGILDLAQAREIFKQPLPVADDHIILGNTLRSIITAVLAADAFR